MAIIRMYADNVGQVWAFPPLPSSPRSPSSVTNRVRIVNLLRRFEKFSLLTCRRLLAVHLESYEQLESRDSSHTEGPTYFNEIQ